MNSAKFLDAQVDGPGAAPAGQWTIRPGMLVLIDEGSMMSMAHIAKIVRRAAKVGAKVIIAGDQEQLAAVESGGGMMLLARHLGFVQLAEAVRFKASGSGTPRCGCAQATRQSWTSTTSTAESTAGSRTTSWTRPARCTLPTTWRAGTRC